MCLETIRNVIVKGNATDEKVIVQIERRMGAVDEAESDDGVRDRLLEENEEEFGDASIVEHRNIVFMRGKTPEQISHDQEHFGIDDKIIPGVLFNLTLLLMRPMLTPLSLHG